MQIGEKYRCQSKRGKIRWVKKLEQWEEESRWGRVSGWSYGCPKKSGSCRSANLERKEAVFLQQQGVKRLSRRETGEFGVGGEGWLCVDIDLHEWF